MNKKKVAKIVVNSLTISRIIGTILLPFIFNMCSASIFIIFVTSILFTDFLDGALARKFKVSTLFGSLADMSADKIFGITLLITLSTIYPLMAIPLTLETLIMGVNIESIKNNGVAQSSQIGRIKMWVIGLAISSLFIVGLNPELAKELNNINVTNITDTFKILFSNIANKLDNILNTNSLSFMSKTGINIDNVIHETKINFKNSSINVLNTIEKNKEIIKSTSELSAVISELYVLKDYLLKNLKNKKENKSNKEIIKELKENKEFIKKIMFDEKYYEITKNEPLLKKLTNNVDKK